MNFSKIKRKKVHKKKKSDWCEQSPSMEGLPSSLIHHNPFTYKNGREQPEKPNSRKMFRCPTCNKRLLPKAQFCIGGEFSGWCIPKHKAK